MEMDGYLKKKKKQTTKQLSTEFPKRYIKPFISISRIHKAKFLSKTRLYFFVKAAFHSRNFSKTKFPEKFKKK